MLVTLVVAFAANSARLSLLGQWVCLADNVHQVGKVPKTTMTFLANGLVRGTAKGERPHTGRYREESATEWQVRELREIKALGIKWTSGQVRHLPSKKGGFMISFAPKHGSFLDWGGSLLEFDPGSQILFNPITQLWCRPGDEKRVLAMVRAEEKRRTGTP